MNPQILSLGTYLMVCAFIFKLFEKGDALINDDAKQQLKGPDSVIFQKTLRQVRESWSNK